MMRCRCRYRYRYRYRYRTRSCPGRRGPNADPSVGLRRAARPDTAVLRSPGLARSGRVPWTLVDTFDNLAERRGLGSVGFDRVLSHSWNSPRWPCRRATTPRRGTLISTWARWRLGRVTGDINVLAPGRDAPAATRAAPLEHGTGVTTRRPEAPSPRTVQHDAPGSDCGYSGACGRHRLRR